jgi:adenylate cyclase
MLGDVYGRTVNLASRLTHVAVPGTVLLDEATAVAASRAAGLWVSPLRPCTLQGIGQVRASVAQQR